MYGIAKISNITKIQTHQFETLCHIFNVLPDISNKSIHKDIYNPIVKQTAIVR